MSRAEEFFQAQLAHLPTSERAELASLLLRSLDEGRDDPDGEEAWEAEIHRRVAEIESGQAVGYPAEEVLAELRKPRP